MGVGGGGGRVRGKDTARRPHHTLTRAATALRRRLTFAPLKNMYPEAAEAARGAPLDAAKATAKGKGKGK
jgi:hypothetical protein